MLVQQLRWVLKNVYYSSPLGLVAITVLTFVLYNEHNANGMLAWAGITLVLRVLCFWHAKQWLDTDGATRPAARVARELVALHCAMGAAWSGLVWAAQAPTDLTTGLIMWGGSFANLTSSLTMLSPFLPAAVASVGMQSISWVLLSLLRADYALALGTAVFPLGLLMHGRTIAKNTVSGIALRFENLDLVADLRVQRQRAMDAHQEAEEANQAKSTFLAAASHDLRQPLHALGLFLEVLASSALNPKQRLALDNARAVSDVSNRMLDALLDFSRIEANAVAPQLRSFHLQPLINKIEVELAGQADAKGLVYRTRECHVAVQSDPVLLERILRNLVSNAIRYTPRGGLLVAGRVHGDTVWLEVWDTGIGIAADQRQAIFREFHQLANPERDRDQGLGLGLAIVDGLARKLGHPLVLASRPGRGTVFRLGLPIATTAVVADTDGRAPLPQRHLDMRILVIDDDGAVRSGMHGLLTEWGARCDAVESIEAAVHSAAALRPDFVISDFRLRSGHTGAEAIAAVRAALGHDVPALLITGDTAPERWRQALASGVPLLHKPVSPSELWRRLAG